MLEGRWTYRSFRDVPELVGGDARAALALIFGEGVLDIRAAQGGRVRGGLGFGTGVALTVEGELLPGEPPGFALVGRGVDGTATAGWRYDYRGVAAYRWPDGVGQVATLLGSVIRVHPHGPSAPAGVTASFVAVRHDDDPPARTLRESALVQGLADPVPPGP